MYLAFVVVLYLTLDACWSVMHSRALLTHVSQRNLSLQLRQYVKINQ